MHWQRVCLFMLDLMTKRLSTALLQSGVRKVAYRQAGGCKLQWQRT